MPIDEIVDISQTRMRRRRQLLARVGVPLLGVVLVILSILGVTFYTYQANRQTALDLTHDVLNTLQARIAHEVDNYLAPATRAAFIARDMVARNAIPDGRTAMEAYASSMLRQVPNLSGFFIGNSNGDFMMVRRDPQGGTDTKYILNSVAGRRVASVHLDDAGACHRRQGDAGRQFRSPPARLVPGRAAHQQRLLVAAVHLLHHPDARHHGGDPLRREQRTRLAAARVRRRHPPWPNSPGS